MQNTSSPRRRIGPAVFGQGTLFGILFGLVILAIALINQFGPGLPNWVSWIIVGAWFLTVILASYFASRRTRSVGAGTLAGLWTGILNALFTDIYFVVLYLITFAQSNAQVDDALRKAQQQLQQSGVSYTITRGSILTGIIIAGVILLIVSLAFGSAVGAIIGLIGKSSAGPAPQQSYSSYPPAPQR